MNRVIKIPYYSEHNNIKIRSPKHMIYKNKENLLEVKGSKACFTRPEMKVERVSYDIITPSAARAIFESIFWKPAIQWNITRIDVLNPIRWFSMK